MRARGVCWAILATCLVAGACGSDKAPSKKKRAPSGGGEANASGAPEGGSDNPGGKSSSQGGSDNVGAGEPAVGASGAGGGSDAVDNTPGPKPIHFIVDATQAVHPISDLIYGANMDGLDCADAKARFTFCRSRSAAWSTYNWENNASNAGNSGCNENNAALSSSTDPAKGVTALIDQADASGASTIVTVPMLDHVALDKTAGSAAPDCSGDVSKTADYLSTRFAQNRPRKGAALSLQPDTGDAYVSQDEFLAFLKDSHPTSSLLFSLDTQPELWFSEHPKLRSTHLSYGEQVSLSTDYAKMIKDGWPDAKVIGLVGYGYLAALNQQTSPDYDQHGEFYGYFLKQMAAASTDDGRRLLDYVDLHWFPEIYVGSERIIGEDASDAAAQARVQAPRTLWDPKFVEDSWITAANGKKAIQLLPWLNQSVADNYPDTQVSLSEWSYGGGKHISGAVAAADALGLYGQWGVGLAGVVSFSPDDEPYLIGAFEAYRNYDGNKHTFGDTSVAASSSNVQRGSIYASIDKADPSRMVLVAINRYAFELEASVSVTSGSSYTSVTPYSIVAGQPDPTPGNAVSASMPNEFELTLPAYSVTVLVPSE